MDGRLSLRPHVILHLTAGICLSVISLFVSVAGMETVFRWLRCDFRRQDAAWRRLPPFFRRPMTPMAGALFRRAGPDEWTGQVIRAYVRHERLPTEPYDDEPAITVKYDEHGFRNESHPGAWSVAVAGDSFVELGHLPFGQSALLGTHSPRMGSAD